MHAGFPFLPSLTKNEKMESSQDARSEREENLHSIISKIADGAHNIHESGLDESDFLIVSSEHRSFKRKLEQNEESRKITKGDLDSGVKFITDEIKPDIDAMAVQIFSELPEENPFRLADAVPEQDLIHPPTEPVYQQLTLEDPSSEVREALEDPLDDVEVASDAGSPVPMPQMALGLMPTPNVTPPQEVTTEQIHLQFQKKLEELEQQVKVLQNRNLALEESYKKLSDLVEAQNHLLASGGPFIQRLAPATPQETLADTTAKTETPEAPPLPNVPFVSEKTLFSNSQQLYRSGLRSYELPRRVSAKEVLNLWEHGCEEFPPLKDWTPTQKLKQQSKISRWKKLVDIFKLHYHGDMKKFEESFSDNKGEILPVTTILSLYETQQTPAFLGKNNSDHEGAAAFSKEKVDAQDVDEDFKKEIRKSVDSELEDYEGTDVNREPTKVGEDNSMAQPSAEVRYFLPRKVTPNDIVRLWEEGCEEFPPVCQWSRAQKIGQETKIFRWRKIAEIFNKDCNRNWDTFYAKYSNDRGHLLAISSIIAKYDAENATTGPIFDIPEARSRLSTSVDEQDETESGEMSPSAAPSNGASGVKLESLSPGEGSSHILPRKVTAKDIIKLWETGYGDLPPLHKWTPAQKAGQRSKFSRWTKIYDIYKYHCKGDLSLFESKFSDERGELYPVTTIVAMFDAWESPSSLSSPFAVALPGQKTGEGTESEIYQLPRKVTAKDVVQLWEEGCELFPPVNKWPKIHKVGHETKLFRWKKIVDIFRKDCGGSWEKFEERFSNAKGELLPISAILSKYDLENEPPSYLPKHFASALNNSGMVPKDEVGGQNVELQDQEHDKVIGSDSEILEGDGTSTKKGSDFILPKKVNALDVIYLWENGLGDMPPLCQWSPAQKASQRSKISRWNKIVDIFKYECGSDIRKFEEKYRDEKGELLPITNILNLHDAQDKSL